MDSLPKRGLQRGYSVFGTGECQQHRQGQCGVEVSLGNGLQQGGEHSARPVHPGSRTKAESESARGEGGAADDRSVPVNIPKLCRKVPKSWISDAGTRIHILL